MIFLIGGPPRCGKTTLAGKLAAALGCSWLPCDYLGSAISRYVPIEQREELFPSMGIGESNDVRYAQLSADEMIVGYRTKARTTWTGLQALIEYAIADERDFVLEGFHIEPGFARQMAMAHGVEAISAVFLYREDIEDIVAGLKRGEGKNDWVRRNTREEVTFRRIATMISRYGQAIREEAARERFPAFNLDHRFDAQLDAALRRLISASQR
jgi:2-phosphoglycerate kinase